MTGRHLQLMSKKIEVGDVVRLKSGGPRMTVEDVEALDGEPYEDEDEDGDDPPKPRGPGSQARCAWFMQSGEDRWQWFAIEALTRHAPAEGT